MDIVIFKKIIITLFITFKAAPDKKIRSLPIDESLTVSAARQLRVAATLG